MTEEDCRKVGDNMRSIWLAEAKKATPPGGPASEKAPAVIRSEADKVGADWAVECKKELEGRRVDGKEMECLLKATTIAEIHKCSEL